MLEGEQEIRRACFTYEYRENLSQVTAILKVIHTLFMAQMHGNGTGHCVSNLSRVIDKKGPVKLMGENCSSTFTGYIKIASFYH